MGGTDDPVLQQQEALRPEPFVCRPVGRTQDEGLCVFDDGREIEYVLEPELDGDVAQGVGDPLGGTGLRDPMGELRTRGDGFGVADLIAEPPEARAQTLATVAHQGLREDVQEAVRHRRAGHQAAVLEGREQLQGGPGALAVRAT
jgi:hypothetical protein